MWAPVPFSKVESFMDPPGGLFSRCQTFGVRGADARDILFHDKSMTITQLTELNRMNTRPYTAGFE